MQTMFRSLLGLAFRLLVLAAPVFDIQAGKIPEYEWQPVTMTAPWAARDGAGLLSFHGKMWLLGGWNPDTALREFFPLICNNDVWYSADGVEWTELPNTPWKPRHAASLVVHSGSLWMIAGNNMQPDVWRLSRKPVEPIENSLKGN